MSKLWVFVDSSTKKSSNKNKYGESVAAWGAWWDKTFHEKPVRCGIHYFKYEGPNKCFYEGIIRALEQCMPLIWEDNEIIVSGDCKPVIEQLNGERKVGDMRKYFNQVQGIKNKYRGVVKFEYVNEDAPVYKKIDQLAKLSRTYIINILK